MNNMSQGLGSFNNMMPQNNMMQQNPYGQQMNPQMMGQQMQSPEMFSEQLMNPMMSQIQDPMQGLQPMAEPEGFGVYGQSLEGYAEGGEAVPRETEIMGQPHMLAYINPEEEMMLRQMGGSGMAGPGGVPSYFFSAIKDFFSSEPTPSEPRGNPAAMAEQKAEKDERPTTIKGAVNQAISDVRMGIGALSGGETTPGYKERSRLSLANAQAIEKKRQKDDDRDASRAAAAATPVATTAAGTGIDTIPISTSLPSGAGTVGANYGGQSEGQGSFRKDYSYLGNDNFRANDLTNEGNTIGYSTNPDSYGNSVAINASGGFDVMSADMSQTKNYGTLEEALAAAQSLGTNFIPVAPPVAPPPVAPPVAPPPVAPPVVAPPTQVPAATVDPMTPVGGNFLLPGQQNYGPTPAAALNFDPNTYMQTPQNANVALSAMFQDSKPYTFEELLSQYKPAYSSFG